MDKETKNYIEKSYLKNNQILVLTSEKTNDFSILICLNDRVILRIQTWDCLCYDCNKIASTPYMIKDEWDDYNITVPKFGELTEKEVQKAVSYFIKNQMFLIFNIELDKQRIYYPTPKYKHDIEFLNARRWQNEKFGDN